MDHHIDLDPAPCPKMLRFFDDLDELNDCQRGIVSDMIRTGMSKSLTLDHATMAAIQTGRFEIRGR